MGPRLRQTLAALGYAGMLAFACGLVEPAEARPDGAVRIEPPAEYRIWWAKTEACAGLLGRFERVDWYVIPGVHVIPTADGPKIGLWERRGRRSHITLAGDYEYSELVVRHEILHALMKNGSHPEEYFGARCALTWETYYSAHPGGDQESASR